MANKKPKKSAWGAEEIPIEEVEDVDTGDYSDMFPNLVRAKKKEKERKKNKDEGKGNDNNKSSQ